MAGRIFSIVMIAVMAGMAFNEYFRFRAAAADPEGLPYPRRRLSRRIGVALLFILTLLISMFWPQSAGPAARLGLLWIVLLLTAVGIVLLIRDLHDTSLEVVRLKAEIDRRTALDMERLAASLKAAEKTDRPEDTNRQG